MFGIEAMMAAMIEHLKQRAREEAIKEALLKGRAFVKPEDQAEHDHFMAMQEALSPPKKRRLL